MNYVVIPKRKGLRLSLQGSRFVVTPPSKVDTIVAPIPTTPESIIVFIINGGGSVITTGVKGFIGPLFAGNIKSVHLAADQTGSIVIDIWKDSIANFPPTVGDTITASDKPTLSSARLYADVDLVGWNTALTTLDYLAFNVDSITNIERVTVTLVVRRA